MTGKLTLEDALRADGEEVPESCICPACQRPRAPFEIVMHGEQFVCSTCYLDSERDAQAIAEAAHLAATADTWDGRGGDQVRAERNRLLDSLAWTVGPSSPLTPACQDAFNAAFRVLHRLTIDFPVPSAVEWPPIPALEYGE